MLTPGKKNRLKVKQLTPMGLIAVEIEEQHTEIFVAYEQEKFAIDDTFDAYVYYDEEQNLQATLQDISLNLHQFASLKVKSIIRAGAFLEWQLKPDLFMPASHMHSQIHENMPCVVTLLHDDVKQQLIASAKIEQYLNDPPDEFDYTQEVDLLIYAQTPLGYKAIVNQSFSGLLYKNELNTRLRIGQSLKGYVKHIRDDGKADLQLQRHDAKARRSLADAILEDLKAHDGLSSLTDKSSPDEIRHRFKVSKGAYKKALGELFKLRKISIEKDYIKLKEQ